MEILKTYGGSRLIRGKSSMSTVSAPRFVVAGSLERRLLDEAHGPKGVTLTVWRRKRQRWRDSERSTNILYLQACSDSMKPLIASITVSVISALRGQAANCSRLHSTNPSATSVCERPGLHHP